MPYIARFRSRLTRDLASASFQSPPSEEQLQVLLERIRLDLPDAWFDGLEFHPDQALNLKGSTWEIRRRMGSLAHERTLFLNVLQARGPILWDRLLKDEEDDA